MDRLQELRLFARVVERESFTAVAREEGLSQPHVSRAIGALEERLAARLLLRTTRRVRPTAAGLVFYERAKRVLDDLADAEAEVTRAVSGHEGTLRIAASLAYGTAFVLPAVRTFLAKFPNVQVDLIVNDRYVDLVEEGVDLAIRVGNLDDSSHKARLVGREELVVVASRDFLRGRPKPTTLDELSALPAVVLVRRGSAMRWTFHTPEGERQLTLDGPLRLDSIVAVRAAVREGLGIGIIPSYAAGADLVRLLPDVPLATLPVHAVYPATKRLSAKVQAFIEHLRQPTSRAS